MARAVEFATAIATNSANEFECRRASAGLYNAKTATLLATEGAKLGAEGGDARRLILSRLVLDFRLTPKDPLALEESEFQKEAAKLLISDAPVDLDKAIHLTSL